MSLLQNQPIGVFDSGLGGLTVLRELLSLLPNENFTYLGDVARLPYGTKSPGTVVKYAHQCVDKLLGLGVKAIVIACNTATAAALPELRKSYSIPIFGVIGAGVEMARRSTKTGRVLVLATEATVRSEAYPNAFLQAGLTHIEVVQKACPLLVPLAEEGWFDSPVTVSIITNYLAGTPSSSVDTILLGCTHYPLLEPSFRKAVWNNIQLVHGGATLAGEVKEYLITHQLQNPHGSGQLFLHATDRLSVGLPILNRLFHGYPEFELIDL